MKDNSVVDVVKISGGDKSAVQEILLPVTYSSYTIWRSKILLLMC